MSTHIRSWVQKIPVGIEQAWAFFSTPANLPAITPPDMRFVITSGNGAQRVHEGMVLTYSLCPLFSIPVEWATEITKVSEPDFFEDIQLRGPYDEWIHRHSFRPVEGGVEMTDTVSYRLPLGPIGELLEPVLVAPRLEEVFRYRRRRIGEMLGHMK